MDAILWFLFLWAWSDDVRKWVVKTALAIDHARRVGGYDPNFEPPELEKREPA